MHACTLNQAHYVNFDLAKRVLFQLGVSPISISHHWRVLYFILYASQTKKKQFLFFTLPRQQTNLFSDPRTGRADIAP
jgi:hypothetical protein